MIEVIPAILTDSPIKFKDLVFRIEPYTKRIHLDIADGQFVPNKTIVGADEIMEIESAVEFDIHLMVSNPQEVLRRWMFTHADRYIIHIESEGDIAKAIGQVKDIGRGVGLAIKPETSVEKMEPYLKSVDFVQFMTVHPGFQGGEFVGEVVDKISAFHKKYPDIMIMADGGITPETAPHLVEAGASVLVSGSYIVKSENIKEAIKELKRVTSD